MRTPESRKQLEELAEEIFELSTLSSMARVRGRSGEAAPDMQISETEFLALDAIAKAGTVTVGEIQKAIGVLPAQMSRIIRSLETKGSGGFVRRAINRLDKRKVDISLSKLGESAHHAYRDARLTMAVEILSNLNQDDRDTFMRILRYMRTLVAKRLKQQ
jgi:DNA-binding MarR family transcriptional regulator